MKMAVPPGSRRNQLTRRECVVAALHSAMSCAVIRACPFGHLSACYEIDHASNGLLRTTTRVSLNFNEPCYLENRERHRPSRRIAVRVSNVQLRVIPDVSLIVTSPVR